MRTKTMNLGALKWGLAGVLTVIWAVIWAAVATLVPDDAQAQSMSDRTLLEHFNIIAFGNEYKDPRHEYVRKWRTPILVGIEGKVPAYFEVFVLQHIRALRQLTGHSIRLYYSPTMHREGRLAPDFDRTKINLILYYLPVERIPKRLARYFDNDLEKVRKMIRISTCFAKFGTKKNEIRWAIAVFPSHLPRDHMRACVVEELTQVMGLAYDSDSVKPSIFNDRSGYVELTDPDRQMLKMLYDPRITPGMPRREALRLGRKILNDIRPR